MTQEDLDKKNKELSTKLYFAKILLLISLGLVFLFGYNYHQKSKRLYELNNIRPVSEADTGYMDEIYFLAPKDTIK